MSGQRAETDPDGVPSRDPFLRRLASASIIIVISALLLTLFVLGIKVLLAAFGGVLIAVLLRAAADAVVRHTRLRPGWALALVVVTLVALLAIAGVLLAPSISEQVQEVREQLPMLSAEIERVLQRSRAGREILERVTGESGMGEGDDDIGNALGTLSRVSSYLLVALMVGLFGAADPRLYQNAFVDVVPPRHRPAVRRLFTDLGHTLRWWLIGQALSMLVIGVSTTVVLLLFEVPLAIPLGLLVGLLGFVPYLGPLIGAVPVAAVAATQGAGTLIYVLGTYTGVQILEGYVVTPMIQHRTVYLPPAFTVIVEILFGAVLGVIGFVLATPIAAAALPLVRFYRREVLRDPELSAEQQTGA